MAIVVIATDVEVAAVSTIAIADTRFRLQVSRGTNTLYAPLDIAGSLEFNMSMTMLPPQSAACQRRFEEALLWIELVPCRFLNAASPVSAFFFSRKSRF